ncbi:tetratricopeptide repeat protein [Streptomyces bauhiniae]|uniref:Tetratricopeptide repeat protein n=1 Tax=Streptomyces bauhiniae TaxID=2340725 RepID=A0A4Z1D0M7_9ACTN|nr:tetratricopeptide repeat protein [Streptomyces bauhiniae]TGN74771.1 tetratricopeptide repeat protein [Streptomyces bauhiniae]
MSADFDGAGPVASGTGDATAIGPHSMAVSGNYTPRVELPADALRPPSQVPAQEGMSNLPRHRTSFVGRKDELDRLDGALSRPGAVLVQALHGLGGVGKSTLAAYWAETREHGCQPVRWFTADSPAGVAQGLVELAVSLQPASKVLPVEALAEWGLQWLASHTGWLVVLDNVNDPADIAPLLDRVPGGRFLITSRLAEGWEGDVALVRLDVLDADESLDLITSIITRKGPRDLDGAAELCEELGHLPLAVEQAGAYIAQNPFTTPRTYLQLLADHPAKMYERGGVTTRAERTVARVWDITLDRIATQQPEAIDLLRALAWYAPEDIPLHLCTGLADQLALDTALGLLSAYSMTTLDPATGTIAVHRLVQALARTPDPANPHRRTDLIDQARERATANLNAALPQQGDDPVSWPRWRALLAHIEALAQHANEDTDTAITGRIFNETGNYLKDQGLIARALWILQRAHTSSERALGPDDPSTLTARNNLANAYQVAGDAARAISLHRQNLEDRIRVLGPDHPHTLTSRNNLASAYLVAGDAARAISLHQQNLEDRIRVLGPDHPNILTSRNNLASAYLAAGDAARAISLHQQNLEDRTRVLGPDHPNTFTARNNLASAYLAAGDAARAISLHQQNLEDRTRVLGPDHPNTLTTGNNLAGAYLTAGDLARAVTLLEETLDVRSRVLGPDDPNTLTTRNNLAYVHRLVGNLDHAVTLLRQNVALGLERFGPDHRLTAKSQRAYTSAWQKRAVSASKLAFVHSSQDWDHMRLPAERLRPGVG